MKQEARVWYYAFRSRMFGQEPILLQGSAILIGYSHFSHTLNSGRNIYQNPTFEVVGKFFCENYDINIE